MTKRCYVFDLDGTISDASARLHYIENKGDKNWAAFFGEIINDPPIEAIRSLQKHLSQHPDVFTIALTARPEDTREDTLKWLNKYDIHFDALYMRASDDNRIDSKVKPEIIKNQILVDGWEPIMFFDDRTRVVESIRDAGYHCAQVGPGDFDTPPYFKHVEIKPTVTLMIGPSGAGKSTYVKEHYDPSTVVSPDTIREQWWGDRNLYHPRTGDDQVTIDYCSYMQAKVWSYAHALIQARVNHGLSVVIDATLNLAKERRAIIDQLPRGCNIEYVLIDRPLDQKLKDRGNRTEEQVRKYHERFNSAYKFIVTQEVPTIANLKVIDLTGRQDVTRKGKKAN